MPRFDKKVVAACFLVAALPACNIMPHSETNLAHEYFEYVMTSKIGMNYDDPPSVTGINAEQLMSSNILSNGHLENGYRFSDACVYYFEINPDTRKILSWRYMGSEEDCSITPPKPQK